MPSSEETNRCVAVVKYEQPCRPPHCRWMFGRLAAVLGGVLFYPFGKLRRFVELAFYDDTLPDGLSLDEAQWHLNDNARRFLIRK
jgi:hypothetical protein